MDKDEVLSFIRKMQDSEEYLKIDNLIDKHSYKIYARNAYVGIWIESDKSFMICRYKFGPNPYLFHEYHWDTGAPFGTVKPLMMIESCPFQIKEEGDYTEIEKNELINYLSALEEKNPIVKGCNSLKQRRLSAMTFRQRLSKQRDNDKLPVHKWLKTQKNEK